MGRILRWGSYGALLICLSSSVALVFQGRTRGLDKKGLIEEEARKGKGDCGAKALYIVCKWAGKNVDLQELRTLTETTPNGTSMWHLDKAAKRLGFSSAGRRMTFDVLLQQMSDDTRHAILHVKGDHFVAVLGGRAEVGMGKLTIVDPEHGRVMVDKPGLEGEYGWEGNALLIETAHADAR